MQVFLFSTQSLPASVIAILLCEKHLLKISIATHVRVSCPFSLDEKAFAGK